MSSVAAPGGASLHQDAVEAWTAGDHERAYELIGAHVRDRVDSAALNDFAVMADGTGDRAGARAMLRAALVLDGADADALANLQMVDRSLTAALLHRFAAHWGTSRTLDYEDLLPPYVPPPVAPEVAAQTMAEVIGIAPEMESFYDGLDPRSREMLVRSLVIRALGRGMAPPPLDAAEYRALSAQTVGLVAERGTANDEICGALHRFDLEPLGIPLQVHSHEIGIITFFLLGQYRLDRDGVRVMVEAGDVVVDGGACWGDTSVYFAHMAGSAGRVVALEFDPANLAVLRKNLALNPSVSARVDVVERALHAKSGHEIGYVASGYGTVVGGDAAPTNSVQTVTIDDLVAERGLERIDFIKMDIEGAEGPALLGAQQSLARFRPRLAIAGYHRTDDFLRLPRLIDAIAPGYRFYVDHYTMHLGESILYATPC